VRHYCNVIDKLTLHVQLVCVSYKVHTHTGNIMTASEADRIYRVCDNKKNNLIGNKITLCLKKNKTLDFLS